MIWQEQPFPFPKTTNVNQIPRTCRRKPSTWRRQAMISFADLEGMAAGK
jgi:hypothetical protein